MIDSHDILRFTNSFKLATPAGILAEIGIEDSGYDLKRIIDFAQYALTLPNGEEIIERLLNSLLDNPSDWNNDLSQTDIFGNTREYNREELAKRMWLKPAVHIICGHASRIFDDGDAHSFTLLPELKDPNCAMYDVCDHCFGHLKMYDAQEYHATEYGKTHPARFRANFVYAGTLTDLYLDLERISH
jgi:hypothetical protein